MGNSDPRVSLGRSTDETVPEIGVYRPRLFLPTTIGLPEIMEPSS